MADKTGAGGRHAAEASHDWSTVPLAHSPKGFAELPFPWQAAKSGALTAQQAVSARSGRAKAAPALAAPVTAARDPATPAHRKPAPVRAAASANLTALAAQYGSDKGSGRHRYTELYQMLFHPLRDRPLALLDIGDSRGMADAATADPSPAEASAGDVPLAAVRMWLDYFPKARIHGLDSAEIIAFRHDRFRPHRCDLDDRASIAAAAMALPDLDIIIDDATHASHHQQNAFLELFPRLKSGGLYIIEDLRSSPEGLERPGITRTAALLRSFSETRRFAHDDPAVEAAFNALGNRISGCFLFQVGYDRKRKDQVAVIHKG